MSVVAGKRLETVDLYPSRIGDAPRLAPRQDPVVWGGPEGPLETAQLEFYEHNGFLQFESLFSADELRACQEELRRLGQDPGMRAREETITEADSGEVRSIFAIHELSPIVRKLCEDARVVNIARQLLGSEVYFHQTRINYKPGFRGNGFYWHSDFETWHVEDGMPRMRAVSCSISLTENTEYNGPLMLIPGSHRKYLSCVGETPEDHYRQSLKNQEIGVPDDASLQALFDEGGIFVAKGGVGSVTFFECNVMHGSNSNITPLPRSNVFVVFNSVENTLVDPFCGLKPRPQFIANRRDFAPIQAG